MVVVAAIFATLAAIAIPSMQRIGDAIALGQAQRLVQLSQVADLLPRLSAMIRDHKAKQALKQEQQHKAKDEGGGWLDGWLQADLAGAAACPAVGCLFSMLHTASTTI